MTSVDKECEIQHRPWNVMNNKYELLQNTLKVIVFSWSGKIIHHGCLLPWSSLQTLTMQSFLIYTVWRLYIWISKIGKVKLISFNNFFIMNYIEGETFFSRLGTFLCIWIKSSAALLVLESLKIYVSCGLWIFMLGFTTWT